MSSSAETRKSNPPKSNYEKHGGNRSTGSRLVKPVKQIDKSSPVAQAFQTFQTLLDIKYDRHERLVKLSRDVTIESKRTISMLQRVPGCEETEAQSLLQQAQDKLSDLRETKFRQIALELSGEDPFQYIRAYSPGVQEYVEAVSLLYYLRDKELVTLSQITQDLCFKTVVDVDKPDLAEGISNVFISPVDYVLGIADLTGELMRIAINSIGAGDADSPFQLCDFIRNIYDAFLSFENFSRELSRKLTVLRQSLKKVETACYTLQVRGSEIPTHLLADALISDPGPFMNDPIEPSDV